jgi:hypothetical protein
MNTTAGRTAKIVSVCATPLAVVAAGALVWHASYAAFTGQTRNSGNDWSTGSVALTDDDRGAARFQVANMVPGATDTKCIAVTANASVPGTVKGYAVNPAFSSQVLADHILVTIKEGTGGGFDSCAGFTSAGTILTDTPLTTLAQASDYAHAIGNWAVTPGTQTRTYSISYKFDTTGLTQAQVDDLQGDHAGIDMQWELQSN